MREFEPRRRSDRPLLSEIQERAKPHLSVAEHEFTHIVAIWGVGKSVSMASVEPTSQYDGVTIPASHMGAADMQVAAMASADHDGNGSDQMKAYILQRQGGLSMSQAESIAKGIINSYRSDVLHIASMYLAAAGTAGESQLRQYLRWAEEEVKEQKEYKTMPLSSWSDELEEKKRMANEKAEAKSSETPGKIVYKTDDSVSIIHADGFEEPFENPSEVQASEEEQISPEKPQVGVTYTLFDSTIPSTRVTPVSHTPQSGRYQRPFVNDTSQYARA